MGPWFIRDEDNPFRPGCSYQTIQRLASRGRLTPDTIIRGPSTRQFWAAARDVPGVANMLGECHNCHGPATADEYMCRSCGAVFTAPTDRQSLGLAPVRLLPGDASPEAIAQVAAPTDAPRPTLESTMNGPGIQPRPPRPIEGAPQDHQSKTAPARAPQTSTTRRLRRQFANMRALATLLAIVVCVQLGAIVLLAALVGPSDGVDAAPGAAPDPTESPTPGAPADADTSAETLSPHRDGAASPAQSPPEAAPTPVPADVPTEEQARQTIDQALETAQGDTIDDLERAVRSLERLRDKLPEDRHPPELDGHIRRLNERIRELSLSRFDLEGPPPLPTPLR